MELGERMRRAARPLLLFVGLWAGAGVVTAALPAHADGWQHCSAMKGSLVMNPGLTDIPANQSVSFFARMTGCTREGGSGLLGATTAASQATCATLTTALLPTNAIFAWASGRTSTIALAFRSLPGSPNRLVLEGRVVSGPGLGDRVDGGLHVSAKFTRALQNSTMHTRVDASRREQLGPLNGESGNCTMAQPIGTIKVASFESLKFSTTQPPSTTTTTTTIPALLVPGAATSTSTVPPQTTASSAPIGPPRAAPGRPRRPLIRRLGGVASTTGSGSSIDPESVLGAICLAAAAALLVVLLIPSRRMRRRRAAARISR
jgi:hypothetical protein